jgi:hypothetical protein
VFYYLRFLGWLMSCVASVMGLTFMLDRTGQLCRPELGSSVSFVVGAGFVVCLVGGFILSVIYPLRQ